MEENNKLEEPGIWYDIDNPSLYKKLTDKEVFEWLESTNKFIWKSLTPQQQKQKILDKIEAGKKMLE